MIRVCFLGLGSIGCRHFRNLIYLLNQRNIKFSIDVVRSSHKLLPEDISSRIKQTYNSIEELTGVYDMVFITNPTNVHYETIKKCVNKTKHMFIEKPIYNYSDLFLPSIEFKNGCIYYVACPLRYSPVIKYLKENMDVDKVNAVRVISSSYLPDWRTTVDYRTTYSANKEEGGGVHLDLIHEWDYIVYLFGFPQKSYGFMRKCSNLEIDSDDISLYVAKYEKMMLSIHLDYFGRCPKRQIEIYIEDDVLIGDLLNNEVQYLKSEKSFHFNKDRNDFQLNELEAFLDMIRGTSENFNNPERAVKTLELTEGEWI